MLLVFCSLGVAGATVLDFEGLTTSMSAVNVPEGYGGFSWGYNGPGESSDWRLLHNDAFGPDTGYDNGVVSGDYIAFGWQRMNTIDGSPFDFIGAYLGTAWDDSIEITVSGYFSDALLYERTVTQVRGKKFYFLR